METQRYERLGVPSTRSVLEGGLTVWTAERPSAQMTAQVVLPVGSHDDGEHPELHHLIEHILYTGPAEEGGHPRIRHLIPRGVRGNATTAGHYTRYWLTGPREDGVAIIAALLDIVFDGAFPAAAVDVQRAVVAQEARDRESGERKPRWACAMIYPNNAAVQIPPTEREVESALTLPLTALASRYVRHYSPNHAALLVAGSMTHETVLDAVTACRLRGTGNGSRVRRSELEPTFTSATKAFPGITNYISPYFPMPPHDDLRAQHFLGLALDVLTGDPLGSLFVQLRQRERLVYSVCPYEADWPYATAGFEVPAQPEHFSTIANTILEHCERLASGQIDSEALEMVRARHRIAIQDRPEQRNGWWVDVLRDYWLKGRFDDFDSLAIVEHARADDLAAVASRYLRRERHGCLTFLRDAGDG